MNVRLSEINTSFSTKNVSSLDEVAFGQRALLNFFQSPFELIRFVEIFERDECLNDEFIVGAIPPSHVFKIGNRN